MMRDDNDDDRGKNDENDNDNNKIGGGDDDVDNDDDRGNISIALSALQAPTILVAMASGKNFWRPKFWRKSPKGNFLKK